tara:strand:- start:655 stop:1617 length:963 start_codon:yes stop_codon:yes gene_type:complete
MSKKIAIVFGDPNSINSEIIFKSWKKLDLSTKKRVYLISNYNLLLKQFKDLNLAIKISKVRDINEEVKGNRLKILDVGIEFKNPFKVSNNETSKFIKKSLNLAHNLAIEKRVGGIINCAIDKKHLKKNFGVTEYLAKKCNIKNNSEVMLIKGKKLSVCPITTHVDLKDVIKKITPKVIISKIKTANKWYRKNYGKSPKIAILGLNPHNAEFRPNSEEVKIILPSIIKLKNDGIKIDGPIAADTIFINDYRKYDLVFGMYHDQVLAPFKTLSKFEAINVTLGLKYLRVSPDHGIAKNLIRKNKANPTSLIECIKFIKKIVK